MARPRSPTHFDLPADSVFYTIDGYNGDPNLLFHRFLTTDMEHGVLFVLPWR